MRKYYSIPEAAKICGVGRTTMWRWVKSGKLNAEKTLGGKYRISSKYLTSFITENNIYSLPHNASLKTRILVVDDDVQDQIYFSKLLSMRGYQVEIAVGGFEAGQKIAKFEPTIILLGILKPANSSFELCKQIKGAPATSHIKILILTGADTVENRHLAAEAGADNCLKINVDKSVMIKHIETLLS